MKTWKLISSILAVLFLLTSCHSKIQNDSLDMFARENLIAWCIVPFDASKRSPVERAEMMNDLGLTQLAYDYRDEHLPSFEEEIFVMREHGIELRAVWFWIQSLSEGTMDANSEFILDILKKTNTKTELWLSFPDSYFEGKSEEQNLELAVQTIREILPRVEEAGCSLALYNHGGWFGLPENLVRIVNAIGPGKIKIVYNFHHGHERLDYFREDFSLMLPHLSAVNINGMKKEGPKIITIGEGDQELDMLKFVLEAGYEGPIGILGHTEGEDIGPVLERNIKGLKLLSEQI